MTELSTVYDLLVQKDSLDSKPLPLYHIENNAPLTIILDGTGKFKTAKLLSEKEKKDSVTCMPCTEKSMSRTGNPDPYPLCDKLEYVAGDYGKYCAGKKFDEKYKSYAAQLEQWGNSKYSNKKIKAILNYVKKGTLAADILKAKIPEISDKAGLEKNSGFIRWEVELSIKDINTKTWEDLEIQDLWIEYYTNTFMDKRGFCYGSGDEDVPIAEFHQGKIRHSGDKAKLISANDDANYTYRGRFINASEVCQIGTEISYKAHNALRWLIHTQGTYLGNGLTVVAWCSSAIMIPPLIQNSAEIMVSLDNDLGDEEYDSSQVFARALRSRLRGYYGNISKKDYIFVMVLNAATTGRMSILLYREFAGSDFCQRIEDWHTNLSWFYTYWQKEEKRYINTISAPSPIEIAETAYGLHLNDDTKSMAIKRILPCILDGNAIPSDITNLCFSRASSLNTIKENFERGKVLQTACAVIKYNGRILQKEDYQVGLDKERKKRDYLFGRLWAVADRIESQVLSSRDEARETNAVRYIQRFSKYPASTWRFLYVEKLTPYIAQLKKSRGWFEGIIQEIMDKFDPEEYNSDKALTGEFLLGYHCQLKAFWDDHLEKKAVKDDSANNTEED